MSPGCGFCHIIIIIFLSIIAQYYRNSGIFLGEHNYQLPTKYVHVFERGNEENTFDRFLFIRLFNFVK